MIPNHVSQARPRFVSPSPAPVTPPPAPPNTNNNANTIAPPPPRSAPQAYPRPRPAVPRHRTTRPLQHPRSAVGGAPAPTSQTPPPRPRQRSRRDPRALQQATMDIICGWSWARGARIHAHYGRPFKDRGTCIPRHQARGRHCGDGAGVGG
jgi:hypothetical protein